MTFSSTIDRFANSTVPYEDTEYDSIYLTKEGQIITITSGLISALSSLLIISIVLRSQSKLSSPYHQIMFFMSFWDIIASVAMALTTAPMPQDVIYPFEGKSYGSISTCEVQGFFFFMGSSFVISSNTILNIYFLCTIRYGMREERVKNQLLPALFFLSAMVSAPLPGFLVYKNLINPHPNDTWCSANPYPAECVYSKDTEYKCIRGDVASATAVYAFIAGSLGFCLVVLVVSMIMVLHTVYLNHMKINNSPENNEIAAIRVSTEENEGDSVGEVPSIEEVREQQDNDSIYRESLETSRIILVQALLYVGASFLCWIPSVLAVIGALSYEGDVLRLVFQPLQGFFSALVFVLAKVQNLYRADDVTYLEAFWVVLTAPSRAPEVMIEALSIVRQDEYITSRLSLERYLGNHFGGRNQIVSPAASFDGNDAGLNIFRNDRGFSFDTNLNYMINPEESRDAAEIIALRNARVEEFHRTHNIQNHISSSSSSLVLSDSNAYMPSEDRVTRRRSLSWSVGMNRRNSIGASSRGLSSFLQSDGDSGLQLSISSEKILRTGERNENSLHLM